MWAIDTMDLRVNSLDRNRYAKVFSDRTYFAEIYPMAKKADVGKALKTFLMEIGVSEELTSDGLKEHNSPVIEFMKCCRRNEI